MLVAGGIGAGKAVADRVRQAWAEGNLLAGTDLGISAGELAQSQSVLGGFAHDAGINSSAGLADIDESLTAASQRLHQQLDAKIAEAIEKRASRRAGAIFHGLLELLFVALPAVLLYRLAKNFFYDHLWLESSQPLLGLDFLAQSALWVLVWGLLLRGWLAWRLQLGLKRELGKMIGRLQPDEVLGPLFSEFAAPAANIRECASRLAPWRKELEQLARDLESSGSWQLGRLRSAAPAL